MNSWQESWRQYRQWAETHTEIDVRPAPRIMSDIDALYRTLPKDVRACDPDPEKRGVQEMHRIFARVQAAYDRRQ